MHNNVSEKPNNVSNFSDLAHEWLLYKSGLIKESTYNKYTFLLEKYIMPEFSTMSISEISTDSVNKNMHQIYENHKNDFSYNYFKTIFFVIKSIIMYGIKMKYFAPIDFTLKISDDSSNKNINVLSKTQEKNIVTELTQKKNPNNLGILLSLYTGMKLGEICALSVNDINIYDHTIVVSKTVQRLRSSEEKMSKLVVSTPKSKSTNRVIPLPDFLYKIILDYSIDLFEKDRYILTNSLTPYEPRTLQYAFERVVKKCGYSNLNFHCLRNTFATKCIAEGFDIKTLSEILGHTNASFTMEMYSHSSLELKKQQMNLLNDSWNSLDIKN